MDKIKGYKAEERIDKVLNKKFLEEAFGYERWQNPKHNEIKTALRQAKTLIMTLREENKFLEKECKRESDDYETYYNKWLDADCELRKLKKQNKEMFEQQQDYFVENERLKQSEIEAKEIIAELESKLAEYEKFGLDKDLIELEKLK